MAAQDTLFSVLYDKFLFWSIIVGVLTFGVMVLFMLRFRDGVTPDTSSSVWKIEPGTFPLESDNHDRDRKLEIAFYIIPTILVAWLTFLATASTAVVWGSASDASIDANHQFDVTVNGYQWYWEFVYEDALTWEDEHTGMDVEFRNVEGDVVLHATGLSPHMAVITVDGVKQELMFNGTDVMTVEGVYFDAGLHMKVEILDDEEHVLHTWEHLPVGHIFRTPTEALVIPCATIDMDDSGDDEDTKLVMFNMHSKPIDDSDPRYVGVQHSFWLPEFGVKEDLVPGLEDGTWMYVSPDDAGTFPIRCAEYCGLQHSVMVGNVKVVAKEGKTCDADIGIQKADVGLVEDDSTDGGGH